jgi:succinoglycan biosynthesis protein ExoA
MSEPGPPTVTVIIPARNEAADIDACLARVLAQDHPLADLEVIVVDGDSSDDTADRARRALAGHGLFDGRVVANPGGATPANLNRGLADARGRILCRVDARSLIPPDYVSSCVRVLDDRPDVAVVGGAQIAVARGDSIRDLGIARALNNRYGMGLSRYRRGAASGPADTVYLGAFRTDELRAVGGWDERFATNQDFELNRRMGRFGAVWFEADLSVGYLPRASLSALFRQYHRFGRWKVRYWATTGDRPQPRQCVLVVAPLVGAVIAGLTIRRGPRVACAGALAAGVAAVAVESRGCGGPDAGPAARVIAVAALAATSTGWLSGIYRELACRIAQRC